MKQTIAIYVTIIAYCFSASLFAQTNVAFPLKLSENKRYLIDKNGKPFLIKEISAWALIQALSEEDEAAYLDSISRKGFNTVLTSIINNDTHMAGNPPFWQGISPFNVKWDFSTPNEKYFQHVDRFLKMAEAKGFFVMAVPAYMGYREDASQGWWDEILGPNNDTAKIKSYGAYIGKRYLNSNNLMWIAGGDHNCDGKLQPYEDNLIKGIQLEDKNHLWSGHFDMNKNVVWSTEHPRYGNMMDIDGEYVWTESVLFEKGPQYKTELEQYRKGKMIIQMDLSYEHSAPFWADNENYQWMRRKIYDGLLSGCAGTSFGPGEINNHGTSFKNWQPLMNTAGMQQTAHCFKLFDLLPWYKFIPDQTSEVILSGRREFGSRDYICAARAADSSYYVLYIPKGQEFIINAKKISGKYMRMHWFNPRTGEALKIGVAETRERFGITPPSEEDWVLVFDNDKSLQMPVPDKWKSK